MVDPKVALLHLRTSKNLKATAWGLNQYLSLSPGEVLLMDGLNPGGGRFTFIFSIDLV